MHGGARRRRAHQGVGAEQRDHVRRLQVVRARLCAVPRDFQALRRGREAHGPPVPAPPGASRCSTAERLGVPKPVSIQNDFSLLVRSPLSPQTYGRIPNDPRASPPPSARPGRPQDRRFESELAEACSDRHYNLGLLAYGSLNGGTLAGKYLNGNKPENSRHTLFPKFQSRCAGAKTHAPNARRPERARADDRSARPPPPGRRRGDAGTTASGRCRRRRSTPRSRRSTA